MFLAVETARWDVLCGGKTLTTLRFSATIASYQISSFATTASVCHHDEHCPDSQTRERHSPEQSHAPYHHWPCGHLTHRL